MRRDLLILVLASLTSVAVLLYTDGTSASKIALHDTLHVCTVVPSTYICLSHSHFTVSTRGSGSHLHARF